MNIITIFNRESLLNIKKRKLLISLSIAITLFAIITLIIINNIIVEADIYSYINFQYVSLMIRFAMFFQILLVVIFASVFLSSSINNDKKNLSLQNILCTNINKTDIVLGKYINGVLNNSCIVFASMPIAYISLFFGGYSVTRVYKFMIVLVTLILLSNAVALFISSKIKDIILSLLVSLSILLIVCVLLFFFIDFILYRFLYTLWFFVLSIIISLLFLKLTEKSRIFLL